MIFQNVLILIKTKAYTLHAEKSLEVVLICKRTRDFINLFKNLVMLNRVKMLSLDKNLI